MEKGYMGHMGPLGEEGVPPLGLGAKGWGPSPLAGALPPLGVLVPHGGGEEDGTPLGLYKEGYTPLFPYNNYSLFLSLSFLEVDSPCSESAPGLEFSTISRPSLCRSRDPNPSFFRCSPVSGPGRNIDCNVHV